MTALHSHKAGETKIFNSLRERICLKAADSNPLSLSFSSYICGLVVAQLTKDGTVQPTVAQRRSTEVRMQDRHLQQSTNSLLALDSSQINLLVLLIRSGNYYCRRWRRVVQRFSAIVKTAISASPSRNQSPTSMVRCTLRSYALSLPKLVEARTHRGTVMMNLVTASGMSGSYANQRLLYMHVIYAENNKDCLSTSCPSDIAGI